MKFHIYAVLIQEIKELMTQMNVTVCHTLCEGNQCADFMAKVGASLNMNFLLHASASDDLLHLLKFNAAETFFFRV